jgi:hypothetical protein
MTVRDKQAIPEALRERPQAGPVVLGLLDGAWSGRTGACSTLGEHPSSSPRLASSRRWSPFDGLPPRYRRR